MKTVKMTDRELATTITALRHWARDPRPDPDGLMVDEIEALCDRLGDEEPGEAQQIEAIPQAVTTPPAVETAPPPPDPNAPVARLMYRCGGTGSGGCGLTWTATMTRGSADTCPSCGKVNLPVN